MIEVDGIKYNIPNENFLEEITVSNYKEDENGERVRVEDSIVNILTEGEVRNKILKTYNTVRIALQDQDDKYLLDLYDKSLNDRISDFLYPIIPNWDSKEYKIQKIKAYAQDMLDREARKSGYDSILSACSYEGTRGLFANEGKFFCDRRDQVWGFLISEFNKLGDRNPTKEEVAITISKIPKPEGV